MKNKTSFGVSKTAQEVAKTLNQRSGAPLNIGRSEGPLNASGVTLPPLKKRK